MSTTLTRAFHGAGSYAALTASSFCGIQNLYVPESFCRQFISLVSLSLPSVCACLEIKVEVAKDFHKILLQGVLSEAVVLKIVPNPRHSVSLTGRLYEK